MRKKECYRERDRKCLRSHAKNAFSLSNPQQAVGYFVTASVFQQATNVRANTKPTANTTPVG